MNAYEKTILAAGTLVGKWHVGPAAPNGCVPGREERRLTVYTLYAADYYGRGAKPYLYCRHLLQGRYCSPTVTNASEDGNEAAIAAFCEKHGIVPVEIEKIHGRLNASY